MSKYKLKFYVDFITDILLWSDNDAAKEIYGYDIETDDLPVSQSLKKEMHNFGSTINKKFGFTNSLDQYPELNDKKNNLIAQLRKELGEDFEIIDDMCFPSRIELGLHPKDGNPVYLKHYYVQWNNVMATLPERVSRYNVTFEHAVEIIQKKLANGTAAIAPIDNC